MEEVYEGMYIKIESFKQPLCKSLEISIHPMVSKNPKGLGK